MRAHFIYTMEKPTLATDQANMKDLRTPAARCLLELRDEVLEEWCKQCREQIPNAKDLLHPVLINTIPSFIDNLAEALAYEHPRTTATDFSTIAQEHGGERARLTNYSPDRLLTEYELLREIIVDKLSAAIELGERERRIIRKSFDSAIRESMLAFFLVHSRFREQFMASVSHDLRNPISATKLNGELILRLAEKVSDEKQRERLTISAQRIVNNSKRADRMIQDLLDVSALQFGEKIRLNVAECEMLEQVRDVVGELATEEQARIEIRGGPAKGFWDCAAIRRVIENLVSNAFKYGSHESMVRIEISAVHGRALLSVHNDGNVIPPEDHDFLFKLFRQGEQGKKVGKGWGIGLAMVKGVAEAHGGSVGLDSSVDQGTTFTVDIPLVARLFLTARSPLTA